MQAYIDSKWRHSGKLHYVKSARIRSYSCPHFPAFGPTTEKYFVSLCIQSKCGENADENNSEYENFLCSVKFQFSFKKRYFLERDIF